MTNVKRVNVDSAKAFVIRDVYARSIVNQDLTVDEIRACLMQHAVVTEILPNGQGRRLDLTNYDKFDDAKPATPNVAPTPKATQSTATSTAKPVEAPKATQSTAAKPAAK